jgi:hypothetical protein
MRRHATASTAGSTQRQAGRLGRFFRGSLATRAFSSRVKGSSAPTPRYLVPTGVLMTLGVTLLLALSAAPALAAECPNEIRRQEQGVAALALPDCRAYENASPGSQPHASSSTSAGAAADIEVSADGNSAHYKSVYPASGEATSGTQYLTTRGVGGWVARDIMPQKTPGDNGLVGCPKEAYFSRDLSRAVLEIGWHSYEDPHLFCEHNEDVLDPREADGYTNLFLQEIASGTYGLVSLNEAEGPPGNSFFRVASDDFGTIVFQSEAQLTPEAVGVTPEEGGGYNYFVWSNGQVRLVTFLPDGTPVQGELARGDAYDYQHTLSTDGSKLFFTYEGDLYLRLNPAAEPSAISGGECTEPEKACTVQVDESQGPGASGGGTFEYASADGSKVFFTSDSKLTANSTAVAGREDLYEYDTATGVLTDLTVNASEPADVWAISDASEDGSYVYFVAEAALEGSGASAPGSCERFEEGNNCNLYLLHEGTTTYLASLSVDDWGVFKNGQCGIACSKTDGHLVEHHAVVSRRAQASPGGRFFAFNTVEDLTGEGTGVYLYDAATGEFGCVCAGQVRPLASPNGTSATSLRRNQLLDDGSFFLDTTAALLPADVNGSVSDVYLYRDGVYHLISRGTDPGNSSFLDATADGSDLFFGTAARLVNSDVDGAFTLYDARVGGGFPEPPPLPGCEGEACRGAGTSTSAAVATGTAAFQGAGNLSQRHKRKCGIAARRAQKVSRVAKRLRRRAKRAHNAKQARRLRRRSVRFAKKSRRLSKGAKRCRRANRRAGK